MVITPLDRMPGHGCKWKLSTLQKRILEEGLRAYWRAPIHRSWAGTMEPGSFFIIRMLREFYGIENVSRFDGSTRRRELRHKLAAPRAAASRALSSLSRRGFLQRTGRHCWRLTTQGLKAARQLCPTLQKPTRTQMISEIKEAFLTRKGRLERAGQKMPIAWKDFCAECFLQPQKTGNRPGVKVDLDLTSLYGAS
jgi:DNA-binding MarR family transcriptional regulator